MLKITGIFLVLSFFCSGVFAQNVRENDQIEELKKADAEIDALEKRIEKAEQKRDKLRRELIGVEDADEAEAGKIYARVVKLFPDGILDELIPLPDGESFSVYPFIEIAEFYFAPRLAYTNGSLKFLKNEAGGLIYNLGGTPLETVGDQSREFKALIKFKTLQNQKEIRNDFSVDGIKFEDSAPAVAGNTYLIRAFNSTGKNGIYALHIKRKYPDGSILFYVKLLKNLSFSDAAQNSGSTKKVSVESAAPKTEYEKIEIKRKVEAALIAKGFTEITVDVSTMPMTLRGTYPKEKLAEVMQTAMEANGGFPIKNEATGK